MPLVVRPQDLPSVRRSTRGRGLVALVSLSFPLIAVVVLVLTRGPWWPYGALVAVLVLGAPVNLALGVLNLRAARRSDHLAADLPRAVLVRGLGVLRVVVVAAVAALGASAVSASVPLSATVLALLLLVLEAVLSAVRAASTVTALRHLLGMVTGAGSSGQTRSV